MSTRFLGVGVIHFFTSGFSVIEDEEGKRLQEDMIARARKGGISVIGPNCRGLYCPSGGLTLNYDYKKMPGPVPMISQSGGNAAHCIQEATSRAASETWTGAMNRTQKFLLQERPESLPSRALQSSRPFSERPWL